MTAAISEKLARVIARTAILTVAVLCLLANSARGQSSGTYTAFCNTGQWDCVGNSNVTDQPANTALSVTWFTGNMSADGIGKISLWEYTLSNGAVVGIKIVTLDADITVGDLDSVTGTYLVFGTFEGGQLSGTITPHRTCVRSGRGQHCGTTYLFQGSLEFGK